MSLLRAVCCLALTVGLFACVDVPDLRRPDGGRDEHGLDAGARADSGTDGGGAADAGGTDLGQVDSSAPTMPTCTRPERAGLTFRAPGDVVVLDEGGITPFGTQFSFEAWVRLHARAGASSEGGTIFVRSDELDGLLRLSVTGGESGLLCVSRTTDTVGRRFCTAQAPRTATWIHVAFSVDGAHATLWVDGLLAASGDLEVPLDPSASPSYFTTVGGSYHPSLMGYRFPAGADVDEFALHRGVRYAAAFVPPVALVADSNTIGLYRLDERTGSQAIDESGVSAPAAVHGSAWVDGCERREYFGDGLDGIVTITGTVDLTRDMQYERLLISASGELRTHGHRVQVREVTTVDGLVSDDGALATSVESRAGGLVRLSSSHVSGAGELRARGADCTATSAAGAGGLVSVVTEDPELPLGLTVNVEGGACDAPGAAGVAGEVRLVVVAP